MPCGVTSLTNVSVAIGGLLPAESEGVSMTHEHLAMMIGSYDLWIVAVSILLAIVASHVALDLAGRVTASQGRTRILWRKSVV